MSTDHVPKEEFFATAAETAIPTAAMTDNKTPSEMLNVSRN